MHQASDAPRTGYFTREGSLPEQVVAQLVTEGHGPGSVLVNGAPARIGEEFFATEGEAVVAALRANTVERQRLHAAYTATAPGAEEARARLVELDERIHTLEHRAAELEQLARGG
jgi:hypothetical protein